MEKSEQQGMKTFDAALFDLYKQGKISYEETLKNADSKNNVRLRIQLSEGKDPDECIKKDVNLWVKATETPKSVMEYYFNFVEKKYDFDKVEDSLKALKSGSLFFDASIHPIHQDKIDKTLQLIEQIAELADVTEIVRTIS